MAISKKEIAKKVMEYIKKEVEEHGFEHWVNVTHSDEKWNIVAYVRGGEDRLKAWKEHFSNAAEGGMHEWGIANDVTATVEMVQSYFCGLLYATTLHEERILCTDGARTAFYIKKADKVKANDVKIATLKPMGSGKMNIEEAKKLFNEHFNENFSEYLAALEKLAEQYGNRYID